jgi:Cu-Zn family superoxide dismutase
MKNKLVGLVALGVLAGCATMKPADETATAQLMSSSGSRTEGSVSFRQHGDKVVGTVNVSGLPPNSEHGFHVHEKGDCSAPDGTSAGGHFNPTGKPHGQYDAPEHHVGDLPSLKADASGRASATFELRGPTVIAGPASLVGRGMIVHRDPDDFKTQPTGNSGARIACGVIVKS